MKVIRAEKIDMKEILELQYLAYKSEALLVNNFSIQPLTQTYEEILVEYEKGIVIKAVDEQGQIIGSVRGRLDNETLHIGKLIVHPKCQGKGIGTKLLLAIEDEVPATRKELFTSDRSVRNLQLYQRNGYHIYKTEKATAEFNLVYLYKI